MIKVVQSVALLFAIACSLAASARAQDESLGPKTIAFVVGIEKYDEARWNKLKFVLKDARDIFDEFKSSTNFDLSRSRLLLADRDAGPEAKIDSDNQIEIRRSLTGEDIRTQLRLFLRKVKNGDNVLFYIGGHGTANDNGDLLLTASNYNGANYIPFADLLGDVKTELTQRSQVKVAMFLNVCGAGNADNAMTVDVPDTAEAASNLSKVGIGRSDLAIFPSGPRNENTFEDEKRQRSVMAYALLEALRGGAKIDEQGNVTALALFKSIEGGINAYRREKNEADIELPKDDSKFPADMIIAKVEKHRGVANYLVATSLLAAARAMDPGLGQTPDRAERNAQSKLLTDLAIDQYGLSIRRNTQLKPRARLRRAQARLTVGETFSSPAVQKDFEALDDFSIGGLSDVEKTEFQELKSAEASVSPPMTLSSLRNQLAGGTSFAYVLLRGKSVMGYEDAGWGRLLSGFPGGQLAYSGFLDVRASTELPTEMFTRLSALPAADKDLRLILVYDGPSYEPKVVDNTLKPFGRKEIEAVARLWTGPITVVLNTPFGGIVGDDAPIEGRTISLLLEAQERNGMTFGKGSEVDPLVEAFRDGAEDPAFHPAVVAHRDKWKSKFQDEKYVVATPAWIPVWGAAKHQVVQSVRKQTRPLERWGALIAQGCGAESFEACDDGVTARIGRKLSDAYTELKTAADRDVAGNGAESGGAYHSVSNNLRLVANAPEASSFGQKPAKMAAERIAEIVAMRASGASSKQGRIVHVLLFGVEEYRSALVADLPGTMVDLAAYGEALKAALGNPATEVRFASPQVLKQPDDITKALDSVRGKMRPQDLAILVFSGRGYERGGRRFLAGEQYEPAKEQRAVATVGVEAVVVPEASSDELDLWSIADRMRGYWFVSVYDVQFDEPIRREGDASQPLDKHVNSARPKPADPDPSQALPGNPRAMTLPRGGAPARQVHVWVNGKLTAAYSLPSTCGQLRDGKTSLYSPMAAGVVNALSSRKAGTYRQQLDEWTNKKCSSALVFQGDLDVPAFASGEGAEYVDFFRSENVVRDFNLRAALGVAQEADARYTDARHRLARAAILVSLAQLYKDSAELLNLQTEQQAWLHEAVTLLSDLRADQLKGLADSLIELWPIRLELLASAHDLLNDPQEALKVLRDAQPVDALAKRDLATRLVKLTDKTRRQQAVSVLQRSAHTLRELGKVNEDASKSVMIDLEKLISEEKQRQSDDYRIEP